MHCTVKSSSIISVLHKCYFHSSNHYICKILLLNIPRNTLYYIGLHFKVGWKTQSRETYMERSYTGLRGSCSYSALSTSSLCCFSGEDKYTVQNCFLRLTRFILLNIKRKRKTCVLLEATTDFFHRFQMRVLK